MTLQFISDAWQLGHWDEQAKARNKCMQEVSPVQCFGVGIMMGTIWRGIGNFHFVLNMFITRNSTSNKRTGYKNDTSAKKSRYPQNARNRAIPSIATESGCFLVL